MDIQATEAPPAESAAPVGKQNIPPRVQAGPHANESWIVSGYHFFRHGSLESAVAARDHLATQFPKKTFRVHRLKSRLAASTTKTTITELREIIRDLLKAYDEERQAIDVSPDAGCIECTVGTVPNNLNTGLCAFHRARAAATAS